MSISLVDKLSKNEFVNIVENSFSMAEVAGKIGYGNKSGGMYKLIRNRINKEKISISHFNNQIVRQKKSIKEHLCDKKSLGGSLIKRIVREGYLKYFCSECGIGDEYNGKSITLQLDHKNGNHFDNSIENLQFLCPNCHSQSSNWGGRNTRKNQKLICISCGKNIWKYSKTQLCSHCYRDIISKSEDQRIVQRPLYSDLLVMIEKHGYSATGREYGVSDNTIRKWIRFYEKTLSLVNN